MTEQRFVAKTFTCRYDAKEDRLLLTLNYLLVEDRIDFWITRSFLLKLLPIFFDFSPMNDTPDSTESLASPKESTDASTYILTYKEPLLLESVDFKKTEKGTMLVFKNLEKSIFCEALLNEMDMKRFMSLLLGSVPKYEWGMYSI